MKARAFRVLSLAFLVMGLLAASGTDSAADREPPIPSKEPSYCELDACGCPSHAGYITIFSCACSSISQTRSCQYTPA